MITYVLFGHRGTGKSTYLKKLKEELNFSTLDLDEVLRGRFGPQVFDLLPHQEKAFRSLERETFSEIVENQKEDLCICVGAGFDVAWAQKFKSLIWVWLFRRTDSQPRFFLDRPSVTELEAESESRVLYEKREVVFQKFFHRSLQIEEGKSSWSASDKLFWGSECKVRGTLTLTSELLRDLCFWDSLGFDFFEIRNDLLSEEEISYLLAQDLQTPILFSVRDSSGFFPVKSKGILIDRDYRCFSKEDFCDWVSFHDLSVAEAISRSQNYPDHKIKIASEVHSFADLYLGHKWMLKDPSCRVFLPRSKQGRLSWYRLLLKDVLALNFVNPFPRNDFRDQPFLSEWTNVFSMGTSNTPPKINFAAVLGGPVDHSVSPVEHHKFFQDRGLPFLAISITEEEFPEAFFILKEMGLVAAAVTSPLKVALDRYHHNMRGTSVNRDAVHDLPVAGQNTWVFSDRGGDCCENTDRGAVRALFLNSEAILFGGRGLRALFCEVSPKVACYSPSKQRFLNHSPSQVSEVIWGVPFCLNLKEPPVKWRPKVVWDLNYSLSSQGRLYAKRMGARYVSGAEFFSIQAKLQQEFWKKHLGD